MVKEPDTAEINAVIRRDGKPKLKPGSDCPACHKTVLVIETDADGKLTGKLVCPNCVSEVLA